MNSSVGASNESEKFSKVTHIIFDVDGTLIDTETIYAEIYSELCKKYGKTLTDDLNRQLLGRTTIGSLETMIEELEINVKIDEFHKAFKHIAKVSFENVKLMPGVQRLIEHLHSHKIPMAIATNSQKKPTDLKLRKFASLMEKLSHMSTFDDVKRGKPEPDVFLDACRKFASSPKPEECLAIEDSVHGMQAALAAGMQVVVTPDPHAPIDNFKPATLILKSLEEFQPELFGLPPFQ